MVRSATIVVAVWAVLAVPTLCMGGIIMHACGCEGAVQCGHESACWSDPCGPITARDESHSVDVDLAVAAPAADSFFLAVDQDILAEQAQKLTSAFPHRANLPYPGSDVPLLI